MNGFACLAWQLCSPDGSQKRKNGEGKGRRETIKGGFTHSMPCPCRSSAMPCVNSHMPCRSPALLQQYRALRKSPRSSRKYPNC
jgi:hypothetical protein